MPLAPRFLLPCLGFLLVGCSKEDGPARSEAAGVSRAIDALRMAENPQKRAHLVALRAVPCSVAEICALQSFCLAAYEEHVKVLELIASVKASDGTAPADLMTQAIAAAEAGLHRAKAQTEACVSKQGELTRKYRVGR